MIDTEAINNILTEVTSGKELNTDELEQMQSDFRQEFSATKNKGQIVQLVVKFLEKFQNEDEEDAPDFMSDENEEEDPSRNLKNELNRAFNAFKDSFSIFRAAGQEDPEDEHKNQSISDDGSMVWNSNDEDATADFKLNLKEKQILSKNFLKLVGISFEKKRLFQQTINDWKYKALEIKLKKAYLIHKTFFNFRRKMDHKMARAFGILRLQTRLAEMEGEMNRELLDMPGKLPDRLIKKKVIKRTTKPEEEVIVLSPAQDDDDYEEVPHEVPTMSGNFRPTQGGLLARPAETMNKAMNDFIMNKNMTVDPVLSKEFSNLNRARYVRQVLMKFQKRNRDWAFYTILNVNSKRTRAIKNVNDRMKGKLMMALHKNFSKDKVKSSYYKWYVKSNPHILKKLASNMLIKLQLSNTVAAWRMISMVRTHKLRDERAIMLRLAKGLMDLMSMTRVHQLQDARNAMQKMNPNHYTRKGKLLEKTLVRLLRSKANKAKFALDRLRRAPLVCQKVFNRLGNNLRDLKMGALARLRFNRLSKNDQKRSLGLEKFRDFMEDKIKEKKRAFVDTLKKKREKGNSMINRLMLKTGLSLRLALKKLQMNAMKRQGIEDLDTVNNGLNNMRKKMMLQTVGTHLRNKRRDLIGRLKKNAQKLAEKEKKEKQKKNRLAQMLLSSSTGKLYLVLSKLRDTKAEEEKKENTVGGMFSNLDDKFKTKLYKAYIKLTNFSRDKKDEENKNMGNRDKLARKLLRGMMGKQKEAINLMFRSKVNAKNEEENVKRMNQKLFKGLKNYTKLALLKAMRKLKENKRIQNGNDLLKNRMAKRMMDANLRKMGQALSKMREQGMVSESQEERKDRYLKFILRNQKNRLNAAFYKLTLFKNLKSAEANEDTRTRRGMLLGMMGNLREKMRNALDILRRKAEKGGAKESIDTKDKTGFLKMFGIRANILRERLLLKMGKFSREKEKAEKVEKLKKDGVMGILLTKSGDRLKMAFYKLLFNRKRQERNDANKAILMKEFARRVKDMRIDTINKLRGQVSAEKKKEQERKRNLDLLVNMLKDQSNRKLTVAMLKLLRNKSEAAENETQQTELKTNVFKLLGLKGTNLMAQAYRKLVNFKDNEQKEEKAQANRTKNVGGLLVRSMDTKLSMALNNLMKNARKGKEKDMRKKRMLQDLGRRVNKMRNNLIWNLVRKQQGEEMKNTQKMNVKSKLLLKMGDNSRARMADALKKLMINSLKNQFNENNKGRLKLAMLNLMRSKGNLDVQRALMMLRNFKMEKEKEEDKLNSDAIGVLERLKSKTMRLKFSALSRLRAFRKIQMKKLNKKKYLLEIIGNRVKRMRDRTVWKMMRNAREKGDQEKKEKVTKSKMIAGILLKSKNKIHTAFYRLMLFGINDEKREEKVNKIKEKLIGKLNLRGSNLIKDAFFRLWTFKNKARIAEGDQNMMVNLLRRTQTLRLREALLRLRMMGDKVALVFKDPVKRNNMIRLLLDLMDKNNLLRRRVLNRLRGFNRLKKQEEVIKGGRPRLTAEQLAKELENRLNKPKPSGSEKIFHEIENYLKRFPKEGRNQELLDAIADGKIKNIEDLYKYMNGENDPEGFKNVYDLLENKNLPVEMLKKILPSKIGLNESTDVLKMLQNNPDTKLGDLMASLQKNPKDGKNSKAFRAARGLKKVGDAIDEMLKNNDDGRYNKVLRPLRKEENPNMTTLMNLLDDPNLVKQEDADAIRDFINRNEEPNALVNMLEAIAKNADNGIDDPLVKGLLELSNPSAIDYVKNNKNALDRNKKVRDAINGKDDPTLADFLNRAAHFNYRNGWLEDNVEDLDKNSDGRLTNANKNLKNGKDNSPQNAFLRGLIEGRPMYEDILAYLDSQEDLQPLKERLLQMGKGTGVSPIKSNADLLDRLYLLGLEEDSEDFEEPSNTVWDILNKLMPGEKVVDLLRASPNVRKFQPIIRKNKNKEGGLNLEDTVNELKKNRLFNDEVQNLLNEGKNDPSHIEPVKLLVDYLKNIENKTPAEKKFMEGLTKNETLGELMDKLAKANKGGDLQNLVDFIDYGMKENELDKLRKFADKNREVDPQMKNLSDYIAKNPGCSLVDVLGVITEDPEEYGESKVDAFLNGDVDQQAGAFGLLKWVEDNNPDGKLDSVLDGIKDKIDEDGKDPMTDLIDRIQKNNKGGNMKPVLDKLNQKDIKNAMQDLLAYMRANNDDGKYDAVLDDLAKAYHPDLNDLNNVLLQHKGDPNIAKLLDMLNGKKMSNQDLLDWMRRNNADGRYDDIIRALEENPDMSRAELMRLIAEKNQNGELDDLLNLITSEGNVQPKSAWEKFLDYLAKHKDDEHLQDAYDYLNKNGLRDPRAFREYLDSINNDGRYNEMIRLLDAFIDEEEKQSKITSAYDFKLFKPLKKLLKFYLNRLRSFNKDAALLDEKRNTKLNQTFLKLNVSNGNKLRAAYNILVGFERGEKKKELDNVRSVAKVFDRAKFAMKKHDYRDMARAINKLIRFKNRDHLLRLFCRKIQQTGTMKTHNALNKLRDNNLPSKKQMQLMTILLMRTQKFKLYQAMQKLINLRKDERRMNMQSRLSNLYWNLRRNHLKEKRHAFNIWALKDFKNKMNSVGNKLKKFVLKKKMKVYNHQKQLYFEMKYKKLLDGNDTLKRFLTEKDQEHKVKVMESIFERKNPWIGRVLEVFTRRVQVNEQILLWRLVDEMNIEKTSLARTTVIRSTILKQM